MFCRRTVVAVCLAAGLCALAQTTRPAKYPYVGVLTGDRVHVRCGPVASEDYYPCIQLSRPDKVKVLGRRGDWLKIAAPKRCYSLVDKRYVQAVGKEEGRVTVNDLHVRAGSDLRPGRMDRIQGRLKKGDSVLILGERGRYYKIAPPRGVVYWILGKYVKPFEGATTRPVGTATTRRVIATTLPAEEISRQLKAWKAAEKAFNQEFEKPREQRDLTGLLARYQAIKLAPASPLIGHVQARVEFIKGQIELAEDLRTVAGLVEDVNTARARLVADRARMEVGPLPPIRRTQPAEGILSPSGLFTGGATGPKRFIITDPDRRTIRAYVQCTTGAVDLAKHAGAYVRAVGTASYDKKLRMYVVEAEQIIVLRAPEAVPEPKPIVKPKPEPKPKPTVKPKPEPKPKPTVKPKPVPKTTTRPAPKPTPKTTTRPAPKPESVTKPLPATGLPMVGATTRPASDTKVNPEEYK